MQDRRLDVPCGTTMVIYDPIDRECDKAKNLYHSKHKRNLVGL